jgi:hypothetical protein
MQLSTYLNLLACKLYVVVYLPGSAGQNSPLARPAGGKYTPLVDGWVIATGPVQGCPVEGDNVPRLTGPFQYLERLSQ